jgi:hypothetical protein
MDRSELKNSLEPFRQKCAENGKPLTDICLEEAFPGDASTSYIMQVKADWIDGWTCFAVLDVLFDILWETTDEMVRRKIFSIQVLDSRQMLHCEEQMPKVTFAQ